MEIEKRKFLAQNLLVTEKIDLQPLFKDYRSSSKHEFTVPSQWWSPTIYLHLIAKLRGHYRRWKVSRASCVFRIAILCKHYGLPLCTYPPQAATNVLIDGKNAPVVPSNPRIVEGILHVDERIDREGCGEGY